MVVKTEFCSFSEIKVYPGKGRIFVTRAGVKVVLAGSKTASLYKQRKKSAKLQWTLPWRRMHKKVNSEAGGKRKVRKVVKVTVNRSMEGRDSATIASLTKKAAPKKPAAAAAEGVRAAPVKQAQIEAAKQKAKEQRQLRKAAGKTAGGPVGGGAKHAGKGR